MQDFKDLKERDYLEDLCVNGLIILELFLEKLGG
jgi:hypothetical protein